MERTLKDLCFTISCLSTDFSVLGRDKSMPRNVRNACTRIGIELLDLDRQLYFASFVNNDTKLIALTDKIKEATEEANEVNKELDEVTLSVTKARKVIQQATNIMTKVSENASEVIEKLENAMSEAERVLDIFGIEIDLNNLV